LLAACSPAPAPPSAVATAPSAAGPAQAAPARPTSPKPPLGNPEAPIPPQCYTRTAGTANPCWTCHTSRNGDNLKGDWTLQEVYAFSEAGLRNHWTTLFEDPRPAIAAISDAEVRAYVREDNLSPWLAGTPAGAPDFTLAAGIDAEGFLRDGSGWRALRYQPFPGTFWPSNGASDDIYIRLPDAFRRDAQGRPSREIYKLNLALLEAALTVDDRVSDAALEREVEAVDERLAGVDLDGDGRLGRASRIRSLPARYAGAAAAQPLRRWRYPAGTEFVHTVRYLDPDAPGWLSARVKEFRYALKFADPGLEGRVAFYQESAEEKLVGRLPWFAAGEHGGLRNPLGWEYRGWIEDAAGQLRPQDHEETLACMGCHGGIGITVDSGFGLPRKLPGAAGWAQQSLAGQRDRPQAGHREGEVLTYLRRVGGGDEFRANEEMLARYFPGGRLDAARVQRAAPGGPDDLGRLLLPSPARALALNKAYWLLVRGQRYKQGRMPVLAPARQVHAEIHNGDTGLRAEGRVYSDGRLWLDWSRP
ncbi:MAG: hypothetical protein Q8Q73_12705, partial [Stagnimonas sp.]|nr:hypothetical protein [Stagnimonas sp.]